MKGFFFMFPRSAKEFSDLRSLTVTAMFIAISMIIEKFTINFPLFKINFAFLAIAVIGMLCGPVVGFAAGMICDIVGFIANPTGAFMPVFTLIAGVQGLIYGILLYHKQEGFRLFGWHESISLCIRAVIARLLDVVIVNLLLNTFFGCVMGFFPDKSFAVVFQGKLIKNFLELAADIPLLLIILPVALLAYRQTIGRRAAQ